MIELDPKITTFVIATAAFGIWTAYENNAPTLQEVRAAEPGDIQFRQRLLDADLTVGTMAVVIGGTFVYITRDYTILLLMLATFGILSLWRHSILAAASR